MATGNLNDYPELKAVFDKLMKEKEAIRTKTDSLHKEYDKLQKEFDPLNAKMRELATKWQAIERPRLVEIDTQLSAIARSIGGRRTSDTSEKDK